MLNPIRNIERASGPGGPEFSHIAPRRSSFSALRHRPHNYPIGRHTTVIHLGLQEGGEFEDDPEAPPEAPSSDTPDAMDLQDSPDNLSENDQQMQQVVVDAMAALRGQHPDPEQAIQRFISLFGEAEFRDLRNMVLSQPAPDEEEEEPEPDEEEDDLAPAAGGMQVGGLLRGPGTGQSDEIEASTPSGRRVLLSDGEYVIDAPTVAALGDGSTKAGARRLDAFRKAIRRQSYGHEKQAKPLSKGGRFLLAALNE